MEILASGRATKLPTGEYQESLNNILLLQYPKSSGYLKLASKNPDDVPIINPNYLTHPADIERLINGNFTTFSFYYIHEHTTVYLSNNFTMVVLNVT